MGKKIACLVLTLLLCTTPVFAAAAPTHHVAAKAAILYEVTTDTILLEQDADVKLFPASTTKLLTALVALEYGNPQDTVTVTREAVDGLYEKGSASYLLAGEEISFMDLMRYLLIGSGNDAANALAIHISGSTEAFADLMNTTAKELGCENSHFANPHGLHDENHYTTARDLLIITKAAMKNETIAQIVAETEVVLPVTNKHDRTTTKYTTNYLLSKNSTGAYYYEGAIGIKTGSTTPAGLCLIGGCIKGDYTYYSVVLGAERVDDVDGRFAETIKLFEYGSKNFAQQVMLGTGEPITQVPVRLGADKESVMVRPSESITAMLPTAFTTADLDMDYVLEEDVTAPVKTGDVLGKLTVRYEDQIYHLDLVAASDVERSTLLYVLDRVVAFFTSTAFKIILGSVVALIAAFVAYVIYVNRRRAKRRRNRSRKR